MNFATSSGIGAAALAAHVDLVEPEQQPQEPEDRLVRLRVGLRDLGRHLVAVLVGLRPGEPGGHRVAHQLVVGGVRVLGELGGDAGLDLLPHPRDAEERRRVHLAERAEQPGGVGDRVHVAAEEGRGVRRQDPLGDVREREVGDGALRALEAGVVERGDGLEHHVVVGQHDALGVAGRARGVEEGRRQVGRDPVHPLLDAAGVVAAGEEVVPRHHARVVDAVGVGQHHEVADGVDVGERLLPALVAVVVLEDHHHRPRLARDERDLVLGEGVVDRHRDGRCRHRAVVGQRVRRPVGRHDRDRVALLDAEVDQGRRHALGLLPRLGPRDRRPGLALRHAEPVRERRCVAEPLRGLAHRGGHVQAEDARLVVLADCGDVGRDLVGHGGVSCSRGCGGGHIMAVRGSGVDGTHRGGDGRVTRRPAGYRSA